MLEAIVDIDKELLLLINGLHSPWADTVMSIASEKISWIPLYAVLAFVMIRSLGDRGWYLILVAAMLVVATDQVSSGFFKPFFERPRPCHEPGVMEFLHLINNHCGGSFGFISSHAANTAGLATLIILAMRKIHFWIMPLMIFFALINSYSRIYLGVHYPTDIICGMLVGSILGYIFFRIWVILSIRLQSADE